jgi:hypothetical protein
MIFRTSLLLAALACAIAAAWPASAHAEVRRCVTPDGQTVFTDRKCTELGATERLPREVATTDARLQRAGGCARTLQDLVFEMTSAIDSRDANRLAGVYHWVGMPGDTAYRVLAQLDAVANRPLVDIVPVMPSEPRPEPVPAATAAAVPSATAPAVPPPAPVDGNLFPQTSVRRAPVALRVEQTLGNRATPSRTVFGLARHLGCWWVRL